MNRSLTDAPSDIEVVVQAVASEADGVVSLTLAPAGAAPLPAWEPGAHVDVLLPGRLIRQYSLCGDLAAGAWRIAVLREPVGRGGSACVHDRIRAGDQLTLRGPRNNFGLVEAPGYLFIAGGIGVTPLMPMLAAVRGRGVPWRFVYGGRTRSSMAFVGELTRLGAGVVARPEDECGLLPLRDEIAAVDRATAVYCCGPEPLLTAVEKTCAELGRDAPYVERFAPGPDAAAGAGVDRPFRVLLQRSGGCYDVPVGRSILEVLEENGVGVDSSCQEGVCGTCEQRIVSGAVDHRDSLLSEQERAENEVMMICVSRALGQEVVLDL